MLRFISFGIVTFATLATAQAEADESQYEQAYIYALPIIMSYKTMHAYALDDGTDQFKAPLNEIKSIARVYGPKDTAVVSANSDTPYSLLWMDLRAEPVVLCVPEIEKDRYFSVMLQDLSTNLLPYIGSRTTGNGGGCFMIKGPGWSGDTPDSVASVVSADTSFVFAVYRTQLFNPQDIDAVKTVQAGYTAQPLSEFAQTPAPEPAPNLSPLAWDEDAATGDDFIRYLNFNLQFIQPSDAEQKMLDTWAGIGVGAGQKFSFDDLSEDDKKALRAGVKSALEKIDAEIKATPVLAGNTAQGYQGNWLQRAATTQQGWGANSSKEASYPNYTKDADGDPLDAGKANYTLTFDKGQQPPVNAFWSLTMYDAKTQLMIENDLNRYLLNSTMLDDMTTGDDGSLTLYVQKEPPGKDKEANWLPAPDGPFYMLMRLYWPKDEFLDGDWQPPSLQKTLKK